MPGGRGRGRKNHWVGTVRGPCPGLGPPCATLHRGAGTGWLDPGWILRCDLVEGARWGESVSVGGRGAAKVKIRVG